MRNTAELSKAERWYCQIVDPFQGTAGNYRKIVETQLKVETSSNLFCDLLATSLIITSHCIKLRGPASDAKNTHKLEGDTLRNMSLDKVPGEDCLYIGR